MEPRQTPPGPADPEDLYAGAGEPAGEDWSARYGGAPPPPPPRSALDPAALFVLLDAVRRAAPADVQERVTGLIREALLTLRSLIDWYLERLDGPAEPPPVQDIPID